MRSFAALPLKSRDRVLGVLGLASGNPRDFAQEARLLETLAAEISLGLGNFLLLEDATIRADQLAQEASERQRVEEALEKRLVALSRPLDEAGDLNFDDLFDLIDLQRIQDLFAKVTGVAALITAPDGTPITQPSNFGRLCRDIIRPSEIGARNCLISDAHLGRYNPDGPLIHHCLSAGLCNAGASITVGGKHVANWLIGQVRDGTQDDESMREYARAIGVDEEEFMAAFREVPSMAEEQFKLVAQAHFLLANQLSNLAYQNIQQARFITERQRAEKELRESEERLRLALKAANQGLWDLDIQSGEAQVSPEYATMLGYDPAGFKLNMDRWQEDLHPDDRERIMATYGAYVRGEIPDYAVEFRQRTKSGDWKWILSLGKIVSWDEEGRPLRMLGTHTDITERKRVEEELRENEKKYRSLYQEFQAILNAIPDGLSLLSPDLKIVWGNETTTFGFTSISETIGQHCFTFRHGRSEPCGNCPVIRCFRSGKLETQEVTTVGGIWELHAVPLYGDGGELRGAIEVARDITIRKRAEEELRENEKKYRSLYQEFQGILNAMPDIVCLLSPDLRIVWANDVSARAVEMDSVSEILGKHCFPLRHDRSEPCENCPVVRCFRSGRLETQEVISFGRIWELHAVPLYGDGGELRGAIEVARDITIRKRAEEALRQVNETLRATLNAAPVAIIDLDNEGTGKKPLEPRGRADAGLAPRRGAGTLSANCAD